MAQAVVDKENGVVQFFKEKSSCMAKYDIERFQKAVTEARLDYLSLQDALQPKKKFGFNWSQTKNSDSEGTAQSERQRISHEDGKPSTKQGG